ncbi:MAG: histidine--tRNA ligase [Chitinophagaceae bacterium]
MSGTKPSLPQGTRDFSSDIVRKRNYIFQIIRNAFELFGFEPLETPAMENLETLMGKYGEEGDKLIFKILNNGLDHPTKIDQARIDFENVLLGKNVKSITERALRYDLTIPFARYVAMNHGQLTLPYKRYQIQPVWRADRPQKGRYREFYQCDADIVGSRSMLNELELTTLYANVFEKLKIPVDIRINNRKILTALADLCGGEQYLTDITVAIDKMDKIGMEKVKEELTVKGLSAGQTQIIEKFLLIDGSNQEKIEKAKLLLSQSNIGTEGLKEVEYILQHSGIKENNHQHLVVDFTLARGLNYYRGTFFEIKALGIQMGSIGGGGRYDNLTGLFGVKDIAGIGISFGVDRIYDVMEEMGLMPQDIGEGPKALFFNLGDEESLTAYSLMQQLRREGISCELYHEKSKFDKQFRYAEKKNIPYVIIIGTEEMKSGNAVVKNIRTGEQISVSRNSLANHLKAG